MSGQRKQIKPFLLPPRLIAKPLTSLLENCLAAHRLLFLGKADLSELKVWAGVPESWALMSASHNGGCLPSLYLPHPDQYAVFC